MPIMVLNDSITSIPELIARIKDYARLGGFY